MATTETTTETTTRTISFSTTAAIPATTINPSPTLLHCKKGILKHHHIHQDVMKSGSESESELESHSESQSQSESEPETRHSTLPKKQDQTQMQTRTQEKKKKRTTFAAVVARDLETGEAIPESRKEKLPSAEWRTLEERRILEGLLDRMRVGAGADADVVDDDDESCCWSLVGGGCRGEAVGVWGGYDDEVGEEGGEDGESEGDSESDSEGEQEWEQSGALDVQIGDGDEDQDLSGTPREQGASLVVDADDLFEGSGQSGEDVDDESEDESEDDESDDDESDDDETAVESECDDGELGPVFPLGKGLVREAREHVKREYC